MGYSREHLTGLRVGQYGIRTPKSHPRLHTPGGMMASVGLPRSDDPVILEHRGDFCWWLAPSESWRLLLPHGRAVLRAETRPCQ